MLQCCLLYTSRCVEETAYGLFGVFWGSLCDRIGIRWVLTAAAVLTGAVMIAIGAFVFDMVVGCVMMALLGIMLAGCDDGVLPKVGTTWFHPSKRGIAFPIFCVGGSLGGVVCGFIAGPIITSKMCIRDRYLVRLRGGQIRQLHVVVGVQPDLGRKPVSAEQVYYDMGFRLVVASHLDADFFRRNIGNAELAAVSYTHLDVYKRQVEA